MAKHDGLTRTPIFVEDLNAVFGCNYWHDLTLNQTPRAASYYDSRTKFGVYCLNVRSWLAQVNARYRSLADILKRSTSEGSHQAASLMPWFYVLPRGGKYFPDSDEQRRHQWSDDKTVETESREPAQCGDKHKIVRHLGLLADENRAEHVVHKAHHKRPVSNQNGTLPHGTSRQEIDGDRKPNHGSAERGQQRAESHHYRPQYRGVYP